MIKLCQIVPAILLMAGITLESLAYAQPTSDVGSNSEWLDQSSVVDGAETAINDSSDQSNTQPLARELRKQSGDALRLGFVNFRRVMASIPQLGSLRAQLDAEFSQQRAALDNQSTEIEQLESQLTDMPRGDAYSELEKQIITKRRTFARLDASFRDAYSVRRNEELATLQQLVVDEIVGLAKDEGYDVILNDTGVIYVSPDADLTSLVIERLRVQAEGAKL